MGVGAVDQSAADWAVETLAAAEAYAEEQASEAARERAGLSIGSANWPTQRPGTSRPSGLRIAADCPTAARSRRASVPRWRRGSRRS